MNLRDYFAKHNVKRRTGVHKDIRDTLDLEHRRFCQRNQGILLVVSKANMDTDKGIATLVECSIGNGAQTQGELKLFFDELEDQVNQQDKTHKDKESEDESGKELFVEVQVEIVEESDINEITVRRLSLFDSISSNHSTETSEQNGKTEPVISENIDDSLLAEAEIKNESNEKLEPEFSATEDDLDEDFNQETEEELLDIPTFLRRQAN